MGEEAKVTLRNARRDANKHADQLEKDTDAHMSKDQIADLKDTIQELLKKNESTVESSIKAKSTEVLEV
jgi:ribosome recycling factor